MLSFWKSQEEPQVPFFAVIFISQKTDQLDGYPEMDAEMMRLSAEQPGFLGYSSAGKGASIFISYWRDEEAIDNWRSNAAHGEAKMKADQWYRYYHSMICEVKSSRIFGSLLNDLETHR
jgi:heme-degrading monooxygenase HmoA